MDRYVLVLIGLLGAAAEPNAPQWKSLFDGKTLAGWKETNFGGEAEVEVEEGAIRLGLGEPMTGITFAGKDFPKQNFEIRFEAKRILGNDFFCTTTFPVGDSHCSLVVGGWAGTVVGLSNIDGKDASENATKSNRNFKKEQWYQVRIRVTEKKIRAWIDADQVVDADIAGKKISIRPECDLCRPFGIATWRTASAVRKVELRTLAEAERDR